MSNTIIQSGFVTPDGKIFATKKEAVDYLRMPLVKEAFLKVTGKNEELSQWLIDNQDSVEGAFEVGTIKRVTKSEAKQLAKALEVLKTTTEKGLSFLRDNADAIQGSFRWPSVKRLTDEEKETATEAALMAATENNKDLVNFIKDNKEAIFTCYQAGVEKRQAPASGGLEEFLAAKKAGPEALAAYQAKKAAEKAAKGK